MKILAVKNTNAAVPVRDRAKQIANKVQMAAAAATAMAMTGVNALATGLNPDQYKIDANLGQNFNPEGMILSLAIWIARLVGISLLIWGIYGYVTARKDGEAESMNGAIGKLISGAVLIGLPFVLQQLGVLAK